MNKKKTLKFNLYFKENGESIEDLIVKSIIDYLKEEYKCLITW